MRIKIPEYTLGFKIVSLALDEDTKTDLLEDNLEFIYVFENKVVLLPGNIALTSDMTVMTFLQNCNNFDIFELWGNGELYRYYDNNSSDNYFFVTGRCNSNCIMCPSSENSRRNGQDSSVDNMIEIAKHIPSDVGHLTVTGGEPFMLGESIFKFIDYLKKKFKNTEFLFLTNGRIFSVKKYAELFYENSPVNSIVGIPIHGSSPEIHDNITRVKGSFLQTYTGVKRLLGYGERVELRVVVNKLNKDDLLNLAELVVKDFSAVERVCVIGMEMTGNAFLNREEVWISYKESFDAISKAVMMMIDHGIDVRLYNFPLCTVDRQFWTLCEKSISSNKVRYAETCNSCSYKNACSGVFAGTLKLEKDELRAVI